MFSFLVSQPFLCLTWTLGVLVSLSENPKGEADAVRQGHFTFFDVFTYELRPDNGTT